MHSIGWAIMTRMGNPLAGFEDRVQRLIEGGLARLLAGRLHPREVAVQLARAMEDNALHSPNGASVAPDSFLARLNPQDHRAILDANPDLILTLAQELVDLARRAGLALIAAPTIKLLADSTVALHHIAITARHSEQNHESTESMTSDAVWRVKQAAMPAALLILQPDQSIPLDRPVINVGRHRDNHIILDNPNVSRHHAQIRLRVGQFILFDLGSHAGTTINGQPVREAALQPGDVIGLGGTILIYVEDGAPAPEPAAANKSDTSPLD